MVEPCFGSSKNIRARIPNIAETDIITISNRYLVHLGASSGASETEKMRALNTPMAYRQKHRKETTALAYGRFAILLRRSPMIDMDSATNVMMPMTNTGRRKTVL